MKRLHTNYHNPTINTKNCLTEMVRTKTAPESICFCLRKGCLV